jgi:AraC-like DNA-binding protein
MKPFVQRLPLAENTSFVAKTFRTPHYEVGWHKHVEYELILFTEGSGISFIGNHVGDFNTGDIYFLGSQLPHTFPKSGDQINSAVVVQFKEDFCGEAFLQIPEMSRLRRLFDLSAQGLKITGATKQRLTPRMIEMESQQGLPRLLTLLDCLHMIMETQEFTAVSTTDLDRVRHNDQATIDTIFRHTIASFREKITLQEVAAMACMSIPAFCSYFKRSTKKTYIEFLNEVRIGYACSLLMEGQRTVADVCYECGYNNMGHFHKQFLKIKGVTPLQFGKSFLH